MLQLGLTVLTLLLVALAFRDRWARGHEWYRRLTAAFDRPAVIILIVVGRDPLVVRGRLHGDPSGRRVNVLPDGADPYRVPANRVASVMAGELLLEPSSDGRAHRALLASSLLVLTPVLMAVTFANGGGGALKQVLAEAAVSVFAIIELVDAFRD